jgi:hypothetical protein
VKRVRTHWKPLFIGFLPLKAVPFIEVWLSINTPDNPWNAWPLAATSEIDGPVDLKRLSVWLALIAGIDSCRLPFLNCVFFFHRGWFWEAPKWFGRRVASCYVRWFLSLTVADLRPWSDLMWGVDSMRTPSPPNMMWWSFIGTLSDRIFLWWTPLIWCDDSFRGTLC